MGERKVLNKYYPPDFDPAKIPRRRQLPNQLASFNFLFWCYFGDAFVSLSTCLGIQIFRFYFKCTKCSAEITYKTDPKNSDYTVESGATRNFEPWRGQDEEMEKEQQKRDAEEMGDAMKSLENRTLDSKREMDIMAALDEMKSMKSRHATVSVDAMLEALQRADEAKARKLEEKDEALIRSVFQGSRERIKRIPDEELEEDDDDLAIFALESLGSENNSLKE
ncbi:uncharacterized protein [Nicotiana tomentosiformis]|uniref:uncharacterized protein n=1 Tax=Nicotiana tomentosiformis TaxID=4098 RepID=UPI00388CA644